MTDLWDVLALLGIVLLGTGLGMLAPWLGVASAGLALLALGIGGALAAERRARAREQRGA
ncbi:hypothetical protein HHL19_36355 [Streptomyces sp. R302]|uniref:hypothetical protein n=1 Tax=unclassified Streptomyces TaxID=2593676 RepID=UPI00145D0E19|nr:MULTISPECIES: hypothetical protein [unclassified Streptomyces]NML55674.1 hypothetical protein [Streptomyces sp. R301]NML83984.1 hypothetical protein [Streptomyces sp. R302]